MTMFQKLLAWVEENGTRGRCRWCRRALSRCDCKLFVPPEKKVRKGNR